MLYFWINPDGANDIGRKNDDARTEEEWETTDEMAEKMSEGNQMQGGDGQGGQGGNQYMQSQQVNIFFFFFFFFSPFF